MTGTPPFRSVLIANRGEIASRILRTVKRLGIRSIAVYSEADRHALHVRNADEAVHIGPAPVAQSYLNIEAILDAARMSGAEAIHPGYGFLSENADFVERASAAGFRFIGPRPEHIRAFGLKHEARALAQDCGVPLLTGTPLLANLAEAERESRKIGFPLMLKSTAGGGGIGLRLCRTLDELRAAYESVVRLGQGNFGHAGVFLERFVERARHIEVQVFGDGTGGVVALGERDCSIQRRNQKVIEEAPAPRLSDEMRADLVSSAIRLMAHISYESVGTVEFVYDEDRRIFSFLEVNTRLQVEHGVTEAIYGIDLVEWMIRLASGRFPLLKHLTPRPCGAAMEARIYAEDPCRDYRPSTGQVTHIHFPEGIRVDGWAEAGDEITHFYDPLLAKVIVSGETREEARRNLEKALAETKISGAETNLGLLRAIAGAPFFREGQVHTKVLDGFGFDPHAIEVLAPGALSTIQDFPGRLGFWEVGVPPSGPFDSLSFRLVNRIVGNDDGAAALECTVEGPELLFHSDTVVALGGAPCEASLDGISVPAWTPLRVNRGQRLRLGLIKDVGVRSYLAVRHGFDVPVYLGSAATFTLGNFGGHAGRALKMGDVLHVREGGAPSEPCALDERLAPMLSHDWEIGVLYGPHGAPDFFTPQDIEILFSATYEVHYNSARTGVRLIGPKPDWARTDGGEAGLHPSNIHDNAYAVGTIDFTGDMPIILGPDGPSLGGFVCPATVALAELWKVGQLKPGDKLRFFLLTEEEAKARLDSQNAFVETFKRTKIAVPKGMTVPRDAILRRIDHDEIPVVIRPSGEDNILIEFGPAALDLKFRFRAHQVMSVFKEEAVPGIIESTPGIRSLQIHFDPATVDRVKLLDRVEALIAELPPPSAVEVESRIVRLPLSWNDPEIQLAVRKYHELVRSDAPWCPSNIEFIRRINGLESEEDVKRTIFGARYLVLGLGDVYLGAPVATPLDPRRRLVTTKYNPARVWTPENAVGIGGAYMCIYGMEGPGGYQLFGRTLQMWSSYQQRGSFSPGTPWLLRHFDQIEFFPVTAAELRDARDGFKHGRYEVEIEPNRLSLAAHERFLAENAASIETFRVRQRKAFAEERERWRAAGMAEHVDEGGHQLDAGLAPTLPEGAIAVQTAVAGNVWMVKVEPGVQVARGDVLAVLESMKMEIEIHAPVAGRVLEIRCARGKSVHAGDTVAVILEFVE